MIVAINNLRIIFNLTSNYPQYNMLASLCPDKQLLNEYKVILRSYYLSVSKRVLFNINQQLDTETSLPDGRQVQGDRLLSCELTYHFYSNPNPHSRPRPRCL
jgi:hypothetical protein